MRKRRIVMGVLAVLMLGVGLQAQFLPSNFFSDFPAGRSWVALGGEPYNEHLVRDVGGLYLALAVIAAAAAWKTNAELIRWSAVGIAVTALPHFVFHLFHLDALGTADGVVQTLLLGFQALAPVWIALRPIQPRVPEPV